MTEYGPRKIVEDLAAKVSAQFNSSFELDAVHVDTEYECSADIHLTLPDDSVIYSQTYSSSALGAFRSEVCDFNQSYSGTVEVEERGEKHVRILVRADS
jgi:hypothetical protein